MTSSPTAYPVSVKGVVVRAGNVVLLRNERGEWELPGGRIELGETPQQCVVREVAEETGLAVDAVELLDAWMYYIAVADKHVFVVTYGCALRPDAGGDLVLSDEHNRIGEFGLDEIAGLPMPQGYKDSITAWAVRLRARAAG
jgi:8-oxo-dGTP pyrophosphatase MutT (NUDIX family)